MSARFFVSEGFFVYDGFFVYENTPNTCALGDGDESMFRKTYQSVKLYKKSIYLKPT